MDEQIDFRWRYQPCKETDIRLMRYIQSNPIRAKSDIILVAIRSFWLPHAIIANSRDKKKIQPLARNCIQSLKRQAQEISELAGLEESYGIYTTHSVCSNNSVYDDGGLSNFL
ncbi:hypothetical protein NIES4101_35030 [Calothrix sp. NIES-4101]|nr:hypothetical protein NIES4101_35030 [Calothrix sp. NIES-4101]